MSRRWTVIPRVLLVALLAAVAASAFRPVFGPAGPGWPSELVLAVLAPTGVSAAWAVALAVWVPPRLDLAATSAGVLAVCGTVAVTTTPGPAVLSGPYRVLTGALPLDPSGPELAAVAGLCGFAALGAGYLVVRGRSALIPLAPPLVCLVLGLGLSASVGGPPGWCGPAFVVLAALHVLLRQFGNQPAVATVRSAAIRSLGAGVIITAAVGVAVSVLATSAPGVRSPADLRALVDAPVQPSQQVNPLARYLAFRNDKLPQTITGTATARFDRLRMVTFTDFDGRTWSVHADYRRASTQLPTPPAAAGQIMLTADLELQYPDNLGWLPTPGWASAVSVPGLGVDERTGDLVVPAGMPTPARYRVTGVANQVHSEQLRGDQPAAAGSPLGIQLPPELLTFAQSVAESQPDGFRRFAALYLAFTDSEFRRDDSPDAPGGNGLYQISALLREHRGTSEQYASAFAVLCHHFGWDARMVLGFRPTWNGNHLTARGQDVTAWVEVRFAALGWIPVDPTPVANTAGSNPPGDEAGRTGPVGEGAKAEQNPPMPGEATSPAPEPADVSPSSSGRPGTNGGVVLLAVVGATVLLLLAIPVAKQTRRSLRRGARSARARAIGAWREAVDCLRQNRISVPRDGTTGEVRNAAGNLAEDDFLVLATLVDKALYSPTGLQPAQLDAVWLASDAVRRESWRRTRPLSRLRATFDPRTLLPR